MSMIKSAHQNTAVAQAVTVSDGPMPLPTTALEQFDLILPEQGVYCLFRGKTKRHGFYYSKEELAKRVEELRDEQGVYMAMATFNTEARNKANAAWLRCLFIDIDVGAEKFARSPKQAYPDANEALTALVEFSKTLGMRPTLINSSGTGFHVYWALDRDYPAHSVLPVMECLKAAAKALAFRIDPAVPADLARILRPIGSLHSVDADGNERRVRAIKRLDVTYTLDELSEKLSAYAVLTPLPEVKDQGERNINDDILTYPEVPTSMRKVAANCGAVAEIRDCGGQVAEPLWRLMIGVAKHCDIDGRELAHEYSSGDPRYSPAVTDDYFDRWEAGPSLCSSFSDQTDACNSCPHRGKIKSPIVLGRFNGAAFKEAVEQDPTANPVDFPAPTRAQLQADMPDWQVRKEPAIGPDGSQLRDAAGIPQFILAKVKPHATAANVAVFAKKDGFGIQYNEMTKEIEVIKPGQPRPDDDVADAARSLLKDRLAMIGMPIQRTDEHIDVVGAKNRVHPVRKAIEAIPWDGKPRFAAFAATLLVKDVRDCEVRDLFVGKWLIQTVGGLYEEYGLHAAGMLVLAGSQGCGKTRWVANLGAGLPFGSIGLGLRIDPSDKDSVLRAIRHWIVEVGELDGTFRRADHAQLKAFLTSHEDVIRVPYGRREKRYARRTSFVGTVNFTQFLLDDSGNRRYWVIWVVGCELWPESEMRQLWAEALHYYRAGESWHLSQEELQALNRYNEKFTAVDPIKELVLSRYNWDAVNWRDVNTYRWLSATEICTEIGVHNASRSDATRVGQFVKDMQEKVGWDLVEPSGGTSVVGGVGSTPKLADLQRRTKHGNLLAVPKWPAPSIR